MKSLLIATWYKVGYRTSSTRKIDKVRKCSIRYTTVQLNFLSVTHVAEYCCGFIVWWHY